MTNDFAFATAAGIFALVILELTFYVGVFMAFRSWLGNRYGGEPPCTSQEKSD